MINCFRLLFAILTVTSLLSCAQGQSQKPGNSNESNPATPLAGADKIIYSFHDASVAPEYHRSYSIVVAQTQLEVSIQSYGDTLLKRTRPFSSPQFEKVKASFSNLKKAGQIRESQIASGGTSEQISFYRNGRLLFSAQDFRRNNKDFTGANINLTYLVPDLEELIQSTRE